MSNSTHLKGLSWGLKALLIKWKVVEQCEAQRCEPSFTVIVTVSVFERSTRTQEWNSGCLRRELGDWTTRYYLIEGKCHTSEWGLLEEVGQQSPANSPEGLWNPNASGGECWLQNHWMSQSKYYPFSHLRIFLRLSSRTFFNSWEYWGVKRLDQPFLRTCPRESMSPWERFCPWCHTVSSCWK